MMNNIIERWISFDKLPHRKTRIDWQHVDHNPVDFIYGRIHSFLYVNKWISKDRVEIEYDGRIQEINVRDLKACKIGGIINARNYNWVYEVGEKISTPKFRGIVINRFKKKTSSCNNSRFYTLRCNYCNCVFDRFENDIPKYGCRFCNHRSIVAKSNSIWVTDPDIAAQLLNKNDGYLHSTGQRVFLDWVCSTCGSIIRGITPGQVKNSLGRVIPCESCSDHYSYPNKFMYQLLLKLNEPFIPEKRFNWEGIGKRRYDFYLINHNIIVELHGGYHFDKRFPYIPINDREKKDLAIKNGIKEYIIIDAQKSNMEYLKSNIISSKLSDILDFSSIDWEEIDRLALKNYVLEILDYLETNNYMVKETAEKFNVNFATVSRYLNNAIKNGRFNDKEVREQQRLNKIRKHYQAEAVPIFQIENQIAFGSSREIQEVLKEEIPKFSSGSLYQSMSRGGTAYGYHWKKLSRTEFNEYKRLHPEKSFGDFFENIEDVA